MRKRRSVTYTHCTRHILAIHDIYSLYSLYTISTHHTRCTQHLREYATYTRYTRHILAVHDIYSTYTRSTRIHEGTGTAMRKRPALMQNHVFGHPQVMVSLPGIPPALGRLIRVHVLGGNNQSLHTTIWRSG